jgi:hypothetical protein
MSENRWAAFTDDELADLVISLDEAAFADFIGQNRAAQLVPEIEAEQQRRAEEDE